MKMYLRLVSALIQGVEPSDKEKKRNKIFYIVMSIIAGFGIMLPMTFFVGVIIYALTNSLSGFGTQQNEIIMRAPTYVPALSDRRQKGSRPLPPSLQAPLFATHANWKIK